MSEWHKVQVKILDAHGGYRDERVYVLAESREQALHRVIPDVELGDNFARIEATALRVDSPPKDACKECGGVGYLHAYVNTKSEGVTSCAACSRFQTDSAACWQHSLECNCGAGYVGPSVFCTGCKTRRNDQAFLIVDHKPVCGLCARMKR